MKDYSNLIIAYLTLEMKSLEKSSWLMLKKKDRQNFKQQTILLLQLLLIPKKVEKSKLNK
jgi:hypothetical protein